jgi:hypothetical protein
MNRIENFQYHKPGSEGLELIKQIRVAVCELATYLDEVLIESRDKSLAFTALEDVSMRAIKSVVLNHKDSESIPFGG